MRSCRQHEPTARKHEKQPEQFVVVFDAIRRLARDVRPPLHLRGAIHTTDTQMNCLEHSAAINATLKADIVRLDRRGG